MHVVLISDVSGIIEKFNVYVTCIGNYTKGAEHQESFLIGSYFYQNTKFLFIREKTFILTPCLLEEFGSSTISHLFRNRLSWVHVNVVL